MSRVIGILAAGRAAVADSGNAGLNAVTITRVALGSGLKPDGANDGARAALRNQRDAAGAVGAPAVAGDVAVRADVEPSATYSVTEVGIFARIGDAGAEFLFAYWAAESAADAIAAAVSGGATIVLATVLRVAGSDADVDVSPAVDLTIAAVTDATEENRGILKLAGAALADAGVDDETAMTPALSRRVRAVTRVAATRVADGPALGVVSARLSAATQQTDLATLDLPKAGQWLCTLRSGVSGDGGGRWQWLIDEVVVGGGGVSSGIGDASPTASSIVLSKAANARIVAQGRVTSIHRYIATVFEAFYLGPA